MWVLKVPSSSEGSGASAEPAACAAVEAAEATCSAVGAAPAAAWAWPGCRRWAAWAWPGRRRWAAPGSVEVSVTLSFSFPFREMKPRALRR